MDPLITLIKNQTWIIGFDTETGGVTTESSILTAYFELYQIIDKQFRLHDSLDLKIKPDNGIYRVTAQSLEINKINLIEHDKVAIKQSIAGQMLYKKLEEWSIIANKQKLVPLGHNIHFDIKQVTTNLISIGSWENFVSYRVLDTSIIAQFYRLCGKLPDDMSCSLGHLAGYFKVPYTGEQHEAKTDVEITVGVFKNLMRIA